MSIHGMGGNVGDAVAPFVAGALLGYLTWRQVVIVNVIPGIAMAVLLLVLLGGMQSKPRAGRGAASPKRTFGDVLRDFRTLLAEPRADLPVREFGVPLDDAWRADDVPADLSRARNELFAALDRRRHGGAADSRASSRRRSPATSPTRWGAARSS